MRITSSVLTRLIQLTLIVALLFVATQVQTAAAQEVGVSISPSLVDEMLDPGETRTYELKIKNLNNSGEEYFLFTKNIKRVEEGGVPVFADDWEKTGYELADWITLPTDRVTLSGGESTVIQYTLAVPDNAPPGGHFGGIFVSVEPPELEDSGASVGYQVPNIISIRVSGDVVEESNIRQFSTGKFMYASQDVDFNIRIENAGNVLVKPSGPLEIYNALGKRVGEMTFNEKKSAVFPGNTREFDMRWIGDGAGFGRYEAVLSPVYGEDGARKTMSSTVTFWILPLGIIGPAAGVLAVILLVTVIGVRLYVKRALAQANVGRRMVRKRSQSGSSATLLLMVSVLIVVALFLLVMLVLFA